MISFTCLLILSALLQFTSSATFAKNQFNLNSPLWTTGMRRLMKENGKSSEHQVGLTVDTSQSEADNLHYAEITENEVIKILAELDKKEENERLASERQINALKEVVAKAQSAAIKTQKAAEVAELLALSERSTADLTEMRAQNAEQELEEELRIEGRRAEETQMLEEEISKLIEFIEEELKTRGYETSREAEAREKEAAAKKVLEAEAKKKAEAAAKARAEAEAKEREEAKKKAEAAAKAKAEAEAKGRAEAAARAKAEAEAEERAEAAARAKAEEEAKKRAEAAARAKAEAEAKEREEAAARAKARLEAKERAEAAARAKAEERAEAAAKEKVEEEAKKRAEAAARAKAEEKAKERAEAAAKARAEREAKEKAEAAAKAKAEVEAKKKALAAAEAKAEAEKRAQDEYEVEERARQGEEMNRRAEERSMLNAQRTVTEAPMTPRNAISTIKDAIKSRKDTAKNRASITRTSKAPTITTSASTTLEEAKYKEMGGSECEEAYEEIRTSSQCQEAILSNELWKQTAQGELWLPNEEDARCYRSEITTGRVAFNKPGQNAKLICAKIVPIIHNTTVSGSVVGSLNFDVFVYALALTGLCSALYASTSCCGGSWKYTEIEIGAEL